MPFKTAKLFNNGGSQAVRLPAEFRFDGDEVFVRRDEQTGDVILYRKRPAWTTWAVYFNLRNAGVVPKEFMADRPLNTSFSKRPLFTEERKGRGCEPPSSKGTR